MLTARRAAQHFRLSSRDDACEHLYILIVRSSLGPSPPNAGRYTVASRFRCRSCERGYIFPRAPEQFVASPLCLVGYVRWDARSDRVPPLQTIIFSSFPGRTKGCRQTESKVMGSPFLAGGPVRRWLSSICLVVGRPLDHALTRIYLIQVALRPVLFASSANFWS